MKVCRHCNEECDDDMSVCPKCGALVDEYISNDEYVKIYTRKSGKRIINKKLILWFILGFILPGIGFLIFLLMYDSEKDRAKAVLFGTISSTIITSLLSYLIPLLINGNEDGKETTMNTIKILKDIYIYGVK